MRLVTTAILAAGEITVLKGFESKGRPCKEVRVRNEARGRKSDSRASLCKVDDRGGCSARALRPGL